MIRSFPGNRVVAYSVVVLVAFAARLTYWGEVRGTPFDRWHLWDQTDMATYIEQARRIAAGDWLVREPYHPYHAWQNEAGTAEDWMRWYGLHAFHQAPLYSYVLAAASKMTDRYIDALKLAQLALGAGTCLLLALVARALAADVAGVTTGLLCALYGPLYYLEAQILREGPAMFGVALVLWLVVRRVRRGPAGIPWSAGVTGLTLGLFAMFHEFALPLTAATAIVLAIHAGRSSLRRAGVTTAALAAGCLIGFAPLLIRNVAAGAAPLSVSSRPHITLALANLSSATDGGVVFTAQGDQFRQVLDSSGGSTWAVLREIWRGYEGDRLRLFRNWGRRIEAACSTVEIPDNTSFEFHRAHVAVLAASVTFALVFPTAVAAVFAFCMAGAIALLRRRSGIQSTDATRAARRRNQRDAAARRLREPAMERPRPIREMWASHRAANLAVLSYLPLLVAAATIVNIQARYRMIIVPVLMCYAGVFAAILVRTVSARCVGATAGLCLALAAAFAWQRETSAARVGLDRRTADRVVVAHQFVKSGDPASALPFFESALRLAPRDLGIRYQYANALIKLEQYDEALRELRQIEAAAPDAPAVVRAIQVVKRQMAVDSRAAP